MSTSAFKYFKEYIDDEHSVTYSSKRLVETVSASVALLDDMIADVAYTHSVEEKITGVIKKTIDFVWIQSSGCLLYHQEIVDVTAHSATRISIAW
jgi:hypothetical protein